jgi:hypothetical protein
MSKKFSFPSFLVIFCHQNTAVADSQLNLYQVGFPFVWCIENSNEFYLNYLDEWKERVISNRDWFMNPEKHGPFSPFWMFDRMFWFDSIKTIYYLHYSYCYQCSKYILCIWYKISCGGEIRVFFFSMILCVFEIAWKIPDVSLLRFVMAFVRNTTTRFKNIIYIFFS